MSVMNESQTFSLRWIISEQIMFDKDCIHYFNKLLKKKQQRRKRYKKTIPY